MERLYPGRWKETLKYFLAFRLSDKGKMDDRNHPDFIQNVNRTESLEQAVFALKQIICVYEVGFETIVKILNNTPDFQYYENDKFKQQNALKYITQVLVNIKTLTVNPEMRQRQTNYCAGTNYGNPQMQVQQASKKCVIFHKKIPPSSSTYRNPIPVYVDVRPKVNNPNNIISSTMSNRCQSILTSHPAYTEPPGRNELEISIPNPFQIPEPPKPSNLMIIKYPSVPPPNTAVNNGNVSNGPIGPNIPLIFDQVKQAVGEIIYTSASLEKGLDAKAIQNNGVGNNSILAGNPDFGEQRKEPELDSMNCQSTSHLLNLLRDRLGTESTSKTSGPQAPPNSEQNMNMQNNQKPNSDMAPIAEKEDDVVVIENPFETGTPGRETGLWKQATIGHAAIQRQIQQPSNNSDAKIGFSVDGILAKKPRLSVNPGPKK